MCVCVCVDDAFICACVCVYILDYMHVAASDV